MSCSAPPAAESRHCILIPEMNDSTFFTEGEVNFQVGDRVVQATPGYVLNLPTGMPHTFQVKSPRAKFLVWVSNAAAETYINELAEMAWGRDLTPEAVMEIGQKHHIQYIGE